MSRQPYYNDLFQQPRREDLTYGGQSYSNPNMNNGSFRMSGVQNTSFGNQVFPEANVNRLNYGHSTGPVPGQSYDNVQMSQFGTDNRRNVGDIRVTVFQDNRRRDSEVTGSNCGHSDQKSVPFDAQMSSGRDILPKPLSGRDILPKPLMSQDVDSFETRSYNSPRMLPERESIGNFETRSSDSPRMLPERESNKTFRTPSSSSFRPHPHEMKRSFNDLPQWSPLKPKYQRMEQSSSTPLNTNIRKPAPLAKHTTPPKQQSTTSAAAALHKKTDQKPNSSAPVKIDPKTNVPRQPLGKIEKNTVKLNVEKSVSTSKTVDCVKSVEKIEECPWLDAEEVTEEELRLKFPDKSFKMFEESCLSDKEDLNIKENLPEGWTATFHVTGFPVYFHKPTAVVTLSKPYELGSLNLRTHMFPVASIPCLQYTREKERKLSEFVQAHPKYEGQMTGKGSQIPRKDKNYAKDTYTESRTDNSASVIPSNLDKKTKDAFLLFQEELESEMKQANKSLIEEEEYEREMMNTYLKYQYYIDNPDTEETEKQSEKKVIEAVGHEEFLKYCERLFEFDTVKLAVQTDSHAKSSKKTYYCMGREKRQVKTSDEGLTTVQLRPDVRSTGSKDRRQSMSRDGVYTDDRVHPAQCTCNCHKKSEEQALNIDSVKQIPTLITRAGASEPVTAGPADREVETTPEQFFENPTATIKRLSSVSESGYGPRYSMSDISGYTKLKCASLYFGNVKFASGFGKNPGDARSRAAFIGLCMLMPAKYKMFQMQDYVPVTDKAFDDENMFDNIEITEPDLPYLCDTVQRMNPYDMLDLIANNSGISSSEIRIRYTYSSQYTNDYTLIVGNPKKWESYAPAFHRYQGKNKAAQNILHELHPNKTYGQLLEDYGQKSVIKSSHRIDMGVAPFPKQLVKDVSGYRQPIVDCLKKMKFTRDHEHKGVPLKRLLIEIKKRKKTEKLRRKMLNKKVGQLVAEGVLKVISRNRVAVND